MRPVSPNDINFYRIYNCEARILILLLHYKENFYIYSLSFQMPETFIKCCDWC